MAADVALFGLVPAQSKVDDTRAELPGVAAQRSAGGGLPWSHSSFFLFHTSLSGKCEDSSSTCVKVPPPFDLTLTVLPVVQLFEVASMITIKELRRSIASKLNLSSAEGYGLGGLLFRAVVDSDRTRFDEIPRMLKELIPADEIKIMPADDWKKVKEDR